MASGSASAASSVCSAAFGSFSSSNFPSSCWRPYSADSPFNRPLPANPAVAPDSASIITNLTANNVNFESNGSQFAFTSDDGRDSFDGHGEEGPPSEVPTQDPDQVITGIKRCLLTPRARRVASWQTPAPPLHWQASIS